MENANIRLLEEILAGINTSMEMLRMNYEKTWLELDNTSRFIKKSIERIENEINGNLVDTFKGGN